MPAHERTSSVGTAKVRIPIGPFTTMGSELRRKALEKGFDLLQPLNDTNTSKGQAGAPEAHWMGNEDGYAWYALFRRVGRDGK